MTRRLAITLWLVAALLCGLIIARTHFTTDLSAFLPQTPTPEQRVLLDQLRDGVVSRLVLVGIEGGDATQRAALSKKIAQRLRPDAAFIAINNGEPVNAERDQQFLFGNRYLLSAAVTPERFAPAGLQAAIAASIDTLATPAGLLLKRVLPNDPTGEILNLIDQLQVQQAPRSIDGAWASRDGRRALLLAQTAARGADTDGQQSALAKIEQAFAQARAEMPATSRADFKLLMTGPSVFAVQARATIKDEVTRLSLISTLLIITLLLVVYRSLAALTLGLLPVLSGGLVGVVAVSLGFGLVHGITLGFGTTLIGEAVDYSIYLFMQSRQFQRRADDENVGVIDADSLDQRAWVRDFWPTIRLGVLISIAGFSSLLLSSFPGLAQLGLYSIAGLVTAALVTRYLLPHLLPRDLRMRDLRGLGDFLLRLVRNAAHLRWLLLLIVVGAIGVLAVQHARLWNPELAALSPVSASSQALDASLRADIGAPDVRYMIALNAGDLQSALQASEIVAAGLQPLVARGILAGIDSPSNYLPSVAAQRRRQTALPITTAGSDIPAWLRQAVADLPVKPTLFNPFLADLAKAKQRAPLQPADLRGTSLALGFGALMFERAGRWQAILPLTALANAGVAGLDPQAINAALNEIKRERALAAVSVAPIDAVFVDLKAELDHLYAGYLFEAITLSLAGLALIMLLLGVALRDWRRLLRVMLPLIAAVLTVTALLALSGQRLTILHLVGLLLIVAVGSNYALFFSQRDGIAAQTLSSLLLANLTTVVGFGVLGFSQVPVLQAIGSTVGPGAVLALVFAAVCADRRALVNKAQK